MAETATEPCLHNRAHVGFAQGDLKAAAMKAEHYSKRPDGARYRSAVEQVRLLQEEVRTIKARIADKPTCSSCAEKSGG